MLREGGRERRAGPVAEAEQKPNRCSVQAVKSNYCLSEKKERDKWTAFSLLDIT